MMLERMLPLRRLLPVVLVACLSASRTSAEAPSFSERLSFRGELGVGAMFSRHQFAALKYDNFNAEGSVRVGISIVDSLAIDVSAGYWLFFSPNGAGYVTPIGAGLRFEPRIGEAGRLFVDAHANLAFTGDLQRFSFDTGAGFEFDVTRHFAFGPFLRVGMVSQPDSVDDDPTDAIYWAGGLALTVRPFARSQPHEPGPVTATDRDGDGIDDDGDACPDDPETLNGLLDDDGCPDAADPDHDGLLAPADLCPNEAEDRDGFRDDDGCPEADNDADGVLDAADACPNVAETQNDFEDDDGCPDSAPDTDSDGIADAADRCPDQAETYNGIDDEDGCPERAPSLAVIRDGSINITQQINFATDSSEIVGESSTRVLDAVAAVLRNHPELRHIEIQGHTDDIGDGQENLTLSHRRADAVYAALAERGVDPIRLETTGYGESQPLVPGTSRRARAANRRVVFLIIPEVVWREQHGGGTQ